MAAKSFLHHFGWRTGKYQVERDYQGIGQFLTQKSDLMEGSYRKQRDDGKSKKYPALTYNEAFCADMKLFSFCLE